MSKLLVDDHAELDELFESAVKEIETGNDTAVFERVDLFWARLAMHIRAEHLHLFPAILSGAGTEHLPADLVERKITDLQNDHNFFMRELLAAIKHLRSNGGESDLSLIGDMLTRVKRRLDTHNGIEELEVYGWAKEMLDPEAYEKLQTLMHREITNIPPRFST